MFNYKRVIFSMILFGHGKIRLHRKPESALFEDLHREGSRVGEGEHGLALESSSR